MKRKILILTALFTVLAVMCASFASCTDEQRTVNDDQPDEAAESGDTKSEKLESKNSVFTDDFFKDVESAEMFAPIAVIYENAEVLTGEKLEDFKKLLAGLVLEETEENLLEPMRYGGISIFFKNSDGESVKIINPARNIITLSKTESYRCEENVYQKLVAPFGFGVSATGTGSIYALDPKPKEVYDWTKDVEYEVRNDVFDSDLFKDVTSAKVVYSDTMDEHADVLEGEKLEKFEQLMASLRLKETDEGLRPEVGSTDPKSSFPGCIAGVAFSKSDGSVLEIEFSPLAVQLPDEKCYDLEEGVARKILTCFGFEVADDGSTMGIKSKE